MTTTTAADRTDRTESPDRERIGAGRPLAWLLIACGALGLTASAMIMHDKLKLAADRF